MNQCVQLPCWAGFVRSKNKIKNSIIKLIGLAISCSLCCLINSIRYKVFVFESNRVLCCLFFSFSSAAVCSIISIQVNNPHWLIFLGSLIKPNTNVILPIEIMLFVFYKTATATNPAIMARPPKGAVLENWRSCVYATT